ncbi:hypothetical protein OEZ86_009630 [Tetradesmus obliquus]|uniref:Uncharacterized protein n=1 Tax=Tetradesmus obliquus TaxID=3088 RepID=A0ABY8UMU3_TETOB|nr:hypothetical protein OEZ85_001073 [Tetradesmus obliquus]WIA43111.1 hypothetical protein OEZ86_009630 [Tetradesmus obliquus]
MYGSFSIVPVTQTPGALQGSFFAVKLKYDFAGTRWLLGDPSLFPVLGKLVTQVAVYLDPTSTDLTITNQIITYSVSLNRAQIAGGGEYRNFLFTFGWYAAADSGLTPPAKTFWVTASDIEVTDPKTSTSKPIPITEPGWYYLQHVFNARDCPTDYPTGTKCVFGLMKIFKAFVGASCGSIVGAPSNGATASWEVAPLPAALIPQSDRSDPAGVVAGPSVGDLDSVTADIRVDAFSFTSFST